MSAIKKFKNKWDIFLHKGEAGSIDVVFLILVLCLLAFGLIMIASASYVSALHLKGDSYWYTKNQLFYAAIGMVFMLGIPAIVNYRCIRYFAPILYIVAFVLLLLVLIPGVGIVHNGARRWLQIGIEFQPSEIAKLAIITSFASYMAANSKRMKEFKVGILTPAVFLLIIVGMVAGEPHISGAILIFLVGVVMIYVGGASLKWLGIIGGTGATAMLGFILFTPYARRRIDTWLHPFEDPSDAGFQTVQSLYAIGSGGPFGLGLGQSRQKFLYIPEPQNDYIFSIVCEELGFVGAMLVIVLFVLLIWRGFYIAFNARDKFGSLLVIGIITRIGFQALLNIGVVTNAIPPTGISLPFFSYGGTALVMLMIEMGIVLAVSRQAAIEDRPRIEEHQS